MKAFNQKNAVVVIAFFLTLNFPIQAEYFSNIKEQIGLKFKHDNGHSETFNFPEIVGSGVALFDFDNDGDLDVYFVQSGSFDSNKKQDKFYVNDLMETGDLNFTETKLNMASELTHYGIGIATADVNNDGWADIFLSNLKNNQLFINQSGKGFKELTIKETEHLWSTGASFCDINNDGFKDLYVSNYVEWSQDNNPKCYNPSSKLDYCGPNSFVDQKDRFFLNVSGKKFTDKTNQFFPNMPKMPGLNVVCSDINNDGYNDFIVANDGKANLVWLNQNGESFKEFGLFSGLAVNSQGVAEASMGLALSDYDLDGDLDVFFTHLMNESNTLYKNNGTGFYSDVTNRSKLSAQSLTYTGWAAGFLMVNNDINPDLVIFNGAVADASNKQTSESSLKQVNQLFLNSKNSTFTPVENEKWLQIKNNTRGAAFGDIDNDGDTDIIVNNNNGTPDILINNINPKKWTGFVVKDDLNRNLKFELYNAQIKMQISTNTDGSYASANDKRLVFNQAQIEKFKGLRVLEHDKTLLELPLTHNNIYTTLKIK